MQNLNNILATAQTLRANNSNAQQRAMQILAEQFAREHAELLDTEQYNAAAEQVVRELLGNKYNTDAQSDFDYYTEQAKV
jgi:hypothetical protein